eukprot:scaffold20609_cov15-Phaeocystis_antarctica.AAC.1
MAIGGGMSDFGTGRQQAPYAATVPEQPRMCASRVRRAAQTRSLAPGGVPWAASCGATKAAL